VRAAIAAAGKAGVTRYAICQATGIDKAVLYKFAAGERGMSLEALDALAEYLELEIASRKFPLTKGR